MEGLSAPGGSLRVKRVPQMNGGLALCVATVLIGAFYLNVTPQGGVTAGAAVPMLSVPVLAGPQPVRAVEALRPVPSTSTSTTSALTLAEARAQRLSPVSQTDTRLRGVEVGPWSLAQGTRSSVREVDASMPSGHARRHHELRCLAMNIYFEARGESRRGQLAVAAVTLNRKRSPHYPDSICAVVWQSRQFSWTHQSVWHRPRNDRAWRFAMKLANEVYHNKVKLPVVSATHFHARYVAPEWSTQMKRVARIGKHLFYDS
jgi:spore germination cell wall hydrolase CwlJ-like protein